MFDPINHTWSDMIPLAIPNLAGNEARYLQECIDTNFVSSVGPFVDRFEAMVAAACGTRHAIATASGTSALHLMLAAHDIGPGDLVVLPSLSFIATANAVSYTGARPVFIDIASDSWTLDPAELAHFFDRDCQRQGAQVIHRASRQRIAAIMCVHTLGHPADMAGLGAIAAMWNLPLLGDAAAALGARFQGREVASMGAAAGLSFNGNKTVTCGGGGAVVSQDDEFLARVRHLSTTARQGLDYDHDRVGFNYRMTNLQAAVGCAQMERLAEFVAAKTRIANAYKKAFAGLDGVDFFPEANWGTSAHWYAGFVLGETAELSAADLIARLNEKQIGARPFWKPLHQQTPYLDCLRSPMPVSDNLWRRIVTLPCSTNLSEAEQTAVIGAVLQIMAASRHRRAVRAE